VKRSNELEIQMLPSVTSIRRDGVHAALEPCIFLGGSALRRAAAHVYPSVMCNPAELAVFFESQIMFLRLFATSYNDVFFSMARPFMYCILRSCHADVVVFFS